MRSNLKIAEVWYSLGGPEIKGNRSRAFWRDGKDLNVSIDHARGLWHDFVTEEGGSVVALVMVVMGYDAKQAYRWLRATFGNGYIQERKKLTGKREFLWITGLKSDLQIQKVEAFSRYLETESDKDLMDWQWASRKLYEAQQIGHNDLSARFREALKASPKDVDQVIEMSISKRKEDWEFAGWAVDQIAKRGCIIQGEV